MIRLVKLGAHVIMSNSKSKECKKLYKSDLLNIKEIPITRTIQRNKYECTFEEKWLKISEKLMSSFYMSLMKMLQHHLQDF